MDLDLDEIRRATEAATEGPWGTNPDDDGYAVHDVRCPSDAMRAQVYGEPHRAAADATFIAGARSWVPALVAEVERLRAALAYLFDVWLPLDHCNGPRDCAGTVRGCTHCCPDATLDAARALLGESRG